jgi:hypothetical protein
MAPGLSLGRRQHGDRLPSELILRLRGTDYGIQRTALQTARVLRFPVCLSFRAHSALAPSGPMCYDPTLLQRNDAQGVPHWSVPEEVLQWPRTASSGRKLIVVNRGGSYGFFRSTWFSSRVIQPPILAARLVAATAAATPGHVRIVQNLEDLLRPRPTLDVNLSASDAAC